MTGQDLRAIGEALGWPVAIALFVAIVLAKNGWIKVLLRDGRRDEIEALKDDVRLLWKQNAKRVEELAELKTQIAVLSDRWNRKD